MTSEPGTLRAYANIFELQRRDPRTQQLDPPSPMCVAAAKALRLHANALESRAREVATWEARHSWKPAPLDTSYLRDVSSDGGHGGIIQGWR